MPTHKKPGPEKRKGESYMKKGKRLVLLLAATLTLVLAFTATSFADGDKQPVTDVPYYNQGLVVRDWTYGDSVDNWYDINTDYTATLRHSNCEQFVSDTYLGNPKTHTGYRYKDKVSDQSQAGDYYDVHQLENNNKEYYVYSKITYAYGTAEFDYSTDSTVEYAEVEPGFTPTAQALNNVTGWSSDVPKNAGKYIARVWFHTRSNSAPIESYDKTYADAITDISYSNLHENDYPGSYTYGAVTYEDHYEYSMFTIAPRPITGVIWPEAVPADTAEDQGTIEYEYDGKAHTPVALADGVIGTDHCEITGVAVEAKEGSVSTLTDSKAVNVGNYTAKVEYPTNEELKLSNKNYTWPEVETEKSFGGTHDFSITRAKVTLTWPDEDSFVYNGKDQTPEATPSKKEATLNYVIKKGEADVTTAKDVGEYTVTASLTTDAAKNYVLDEKTTTVKKFSITELEAKLVWSDTKLVYNGSAQGPSATVSNLMPAEGEKDTCTVNVEGTKTDAGTYVAKATGLSNANYKLPANPTVNYTILPMPVKVKWGTETSFVYNGTEQAPTATATDSSDAEIADVKVAVEVSGNDDLRWTKDGGIDAGNYTAKAAKLTNAAGNVVKNYTLVNDNNKNDYNEVITSFDSATYTATYTEEFTITPIEAEIAWNNKAFTYNGKEQAPEAVVSNLKTADGFEKDDCKVVVSGAQKNAGNGYTATATDLAGAQKGNYKLPDETPTTAFDIAKCALTVTANPKSISYVDAPDNAGVTYDTLQGSDTPESIGLEISYKYSYVKNGRPGTYTITPSGVATTDNYTVKYVPGTLTVSDKARQIVASAASKGKKGLKFTWNEVAGAASYEVYLGRCNTKGKKFAVKKIATVNGSPLTFTKKKLKAKTAYKFYVVAKDANGSVISQSAVGHVFTSKYKGKYTNAKSITVNASSVTVAKNGTYKLSASYKKAKKGKKLAGKGHAAKTRFVSENPAVATVSADGIITGVSTGWCRVYAQGVDGIWSAVEVTVK